MGRPDSDALVIGAGPAGSAIAIRLASLGWRVTLAEQSRFPRQKVCGECLGPASLSQLDELGLGREVLDLSGPAIRRVAWMSGPQTIVAPMPACHTGRYRYGCAIGRDRLDTLLLEHAQRQGVNVLQPVKVRHVTGVPGEFAVLCESREDGDVPARRRTQCVTAALVIDAHGSWERSPEYLSGTGDRNLEPHPGDLLAFKATFESACLEPGVLPVLCLPGGYGGMVLADRGRTTIAGCIRRDVLQRVRSQAAATSAGEVMESWLQSSCKGVAAALRGAHRHAAWYATGPLRPGFHAHAAPGIIPIGNAAAEAHPLIGEGICMALQSAALLAGLLGDGSGACDPSRMLAAQQTHAVLCRKHFSGRMRIAQFYVQIAMEPSRSALAALLMKHWPVSLTAAARLAGKARQGMAQPRRSIPA